MIDRSAFAEHVRDALANLDDRTYLWAHPLGELLLGPSSPATRGTLRSVLLEAIEQLRPRGAPATSPSWRQYRYLVRRYVEDAAHERVAQELGVSLRQARRDGLQATEAVASILWETYCALHPTQPPTPPQDERLDARPPAAMVDAELVRIGLEAGEQSAVVGETVESVLALVGGPVAARGSRIELDLPDAPIRVATSRTVLRQLLLSVFSFAAETAPGARLVLSATESGPSVLLRLLVQEPRLLVQEPRLLAQEPRLLGADRAQSTGRSRDADAMLESARQVAVAASGALERGQLGPSHYVELRLPTARTTTVLIIDDDPDVARLLGRYLVGTPYRPVHARTSPAALRLAQEVHPDVVILDVLMPAQDGWDILHELRGRPETSGTPIIICSVLSEKPLARSLGADGYLSKPITRQGLLAALDHCSAGRDASGERRGSP